LGKLVYVRSRKVRPHDPGHWDKRKQLEAVTTYLATGNMAETSRMMNIPKSTLDKWKTSDWWKELIEEIQSGEGQRQDNKMSKVIDKALDMLVDRIDEGDYQYDQRTGRLVKVPLKARDLERVTSGLFDKRQLIRKKPTNIKVDDLNQAGRLLKLAEQFAAFAGKRVEKDATVDQYIEGEYNNVVDAEVIEDGKEM